MSTNFKDIYSNWAAKQQAVEQFMKAARCWAGYEPVPGKAPYSEDSCRPAGSKKKKNKASEKTAANSVFPSPARPKMTQMPPKPASPAAPRRQAPANFNYVSKGQQAAEAAARAQQAPPNMMVKTQAAKMSASSLFHHATKNLEPVVNGHKPSTENTKHVNVVHHDAEDKGGDLKPEGADMASDKKPTSGRVLTGI